MDRTERKKKKTKAATAEGDEDEGGRRRRRRWKEMKSKAGAAEGDEDEDEGGRRRRGEGPRSFPDSLPRVFKSAVGSSEPGSGCLNSAPPPVDEGTGIDSGGTGISGATASFGPFTTKRGEGVPWERDTGSEGSPTFSLPLNLEP
ncbi:hypothetical protein LWI29_024765 [Acer saccharum]|uniref:Uncharacterized protein n=1 Tax=Acer saccharum TaxID=4024 RepID=A0AA39SU19_ACESA|nr:hypothetical protein LWI29_024765 [Acer saccharum]